MVKIDAAVFQTLYHALQTGGPLPVGVESLPFEDHSDIEQLGALGVLLHKTERWPYLLTQLRKRISALETYCRAAQGIWGSQLHVLIQKTVRGDPLSEAQLNGFFSRLVSGDLEPGVMGVWLQAMRQHGLSGVDTATLARVLRGRSTAFDGRLAPSLSGRKIVGYGPSGGLSDKVGLLLPALLVAFPSSVAVGSMFLSESRFGLGSDAHDALATVPGFRSSRPDEEAFEVMQQCSVAMVDTQALCPVDDKFRELQKRTGTLESTSWLTARTVSRHLSVPSDSLVLDLRYGEGASFKGFSDARSVGQQVVSQLIEKGIPAVPLLLAEEQPTGTGIGPALELAEAVAIMRGCHPTPLFRQDAMLEQRRLVLTVFEAMMKLTFGPGEWFKLAEQAFADGRVLGGFHRLLTAHGVDERTATAFIENPIGQLQRRAVVPAPRRGRLMAIDARRVESALSTLSNETDASHGGILVRKRLGDVVKAGEPIVEVWHDSGEPLSEVVSAMIGAFNVSTEERE